MRGAKAYRIWSKEPESGENRNLKILKSFLEESLAGSINKRVEQYIRNSGAWPEYVEAMFLAVPTGHQQGSSSEKKPSRWVLLPGLCCQAAGGDGNNAIDLSAAWLLFYMASSLMDSVEDRDKPDIWWIEFGPSAAISVATGLYFCASSALNSLYESEYSSQAAGEIVQDFHKGFMMMGSGQHQDITLRELNLEQYWKVTEAKSGVFFSLACRSGARLGTQDLRKIEMFSQFGNHLGMVIQILDDLDEMRLLTTGQPIHNLPDFFRSLPVLFSLEVLPGSQHERLKYWLSMAPDDPEAARSAFRLMEECGAGLYLSTEIRRHKEKAARALEQADPIPPAADALVSYLSDLGPES
jgi:geranylgeranyl pyrophosphate synthase